VAGGPTYPACGAAMTDTNMDFIYELTRAYDDGTTFTYKFLVGDIACANTGACTGAGFETVPALFLLHVLLVILMIASILSMEWTIQ